MDRNISVRTPESIAFRYDLAGLGSRFLAVIFDLALQIVVLLLLVWGLVAIGSHASPTRADESPAFHLGESIGIALVVFVVFVIFYGYFILFEAFWSGQTPGKKLLGIRVVRDGGYPVDFAGATVRNLLRIGEQLLGFYAISAISALLSNENKRIGDFAAGTIVVRESRVAAPQTLREALDSQRTRSSAYLTDAERSVIDEYLKRRDGMGAEYRRALAAELAERVRPRAPANLQPLGDEQLLEEI